MKHWLLIGAILILATVLLLRSTLNKNATPIPPTATMPTLSSMIHTPDVPPVRGVSISQLKGITIAPAATEDPTTFRKRAADFLKGTSGPDALPVYDPAMERLVAPELLLVRAQPAVYRILEYGDLDVRIPGNVHVDLDALAKAQDATGKLNALRLNTDPDRVRFYWDYLAANADTLLTSTEEQSVRQIKNELMASGTGFLVSRDGLVLTNAHVIGDMPDQLLGEDPAVLAGIIGTQVDAFINATIKTFGGPPAPDQVPAVAVSLVKWFGTRGRMTGTFNHVELALHLDRKKLTAKQLAEAKDLTALLTRPPEPITCPLTVLAHGQIMPGKDVAILRAERGGDFDVFDRAVCLPLGDSDDVLPGTRVQAMGFPGIAFSSDLMKPDAEYRVSAADGQIANTKPMNGGDGNDWSAFEMTADINHGDSGGPVLAPDGRVIALNVGAAQGEKSVGHTLAVPINLARQMLVELKLRPDPGPATALWINGLEKYEKKDYAGAATQFEKLAEMQAGFQDSAASPPAKPQAAGASATYDPSVNPYITEMIRRAKKAAGK